MSVRGAGFIAQTLSHFQGIAVSEAFGSRHFQFAKYVPDANAQNASGKGRIFLFGFEDAKQVIVGGKQKYRAGDECADAINVA